MQSLHPSMLPLDPTSAAASAHMSDLHREAAQWRLTRTRRRRAARLAGIPTRSVSEATPEQ